MTALPQAQDLHGVTLKQAKRSGPQVDVPDVRFVCGTTHVMGIREKHPSCTFAEKIAANFHLSRPFAYLFRIIPMIDKWPVSCRNLLPGRSPGCRQPDISA